MPMPSPAKRTAMGLNLPIRPATVEGRPKTPLPITEFTTSAVKLQRPMARTSCWPRGGDVAETGGGVSGIAWLYHKCAGNDDSPVCCAGRELFRGPHSSQNDDASGFG